MKKENKSQRIQTFIVQNIPRHPADIVALTMTQFKISRPAVHKHMTHLLKSKIIQKIGATRAARYQVLSGKKQKIKIDTTLQEDKIYEKYIAPELLKLTENIQKICAYGFTEILNNVIDHSKASEVTVSLDLNEEIICISIHDNGIGVFKKIQKALSLSDIKESPLHLSKGKFTTDPAKHSGEGIFFTSRAFDEFSMISGDLKYHCFAEDHDWLIETLETTPSLGTQVILKISKTSKKELILIFKEFTDSDFSFSKTNVFVKLTKLKGEKYISRSQAKRLLLGLEKFKKVILDFHEVPTVGQAFVDEVFRVFKNTHPNIEIEYINANEDVLFMIQRGLH